MTAIAGLWRMSGAGGAGPDVDRMLASQSIYGPHGARRLDDGLVCLGRSLYRLLPEDRHDVQPVTAEGGRLVLVADVRLDNRKELCADLRLASADELADAALLARAWSAWGEDCLDRLVGDFAFAIWESERRVLRLVRDPLGQRPLHFHRSAGSFAFASMPKGLHALESCPYAPDVEVLTEFLLLLPERPDRSFFEGVEKVEPGCVLTVTTSATSSRRYWNPSRPVQRFKNPNEYVEGVRAHLEEAVRVRLRRADKPIAAHLSAGLDSSTVAATAARLLGPGGERLFAFTAVPRSGYACENPPPFRFGDEGPRAAEVAGLYPNIDHVLVDTTGVTPIERLDRDFYLYDRPLLNLCNFTWEHEIYREARQRGATVLLDGSAGNLSFSYSGFEALPELLRRLRWRRWLSDSSALVEAGSLRWRGVLFNSVAPWLPPPMWAWLNRLRGGEFAGVADYTATHPHQLAQSDFARRSRNLGQDPYFRPSSDTFESRLNGLTSADNGNYSKGALAGWGIDRRDATADRRLVEFCLSIPAEEFLRGGRPRSVARAAFSDRLPASVIAETRRGYQAMDWHEGLTRGREDLAGEVERLADCAEAAALLDVPRLKRLISEWPTGNWHDPEVTTAYRYALLRGVSTGHFLRRALRTNQ